MARFVAERESPPHRRRKGKHRKRPFVIEGRYTGERDNSGILFGNWINGWRRWHVVGAYETERAMSDALRSIRTKGGLFGGGSWEYRIASPEPPASPACESG